MNARTRLPCDASSAATARRFVADILSNRGFANDCIDDAVLLASEVVTSAVVHARSDLDVVVVADLPMARVEVYDGDGLPAGGLRADGVAAGGGNGDGHGSRVMDALAEAWGVEDLGAGTCVWFEVRA